MQLKLPSVPAYSIGKALRENNSKDQLPGPGQYEDKHKELSVHTRLPRTVLNKAFSKQNMLAQISTPGPGDYEVSKSSLSKRGQYVIGSSRREFNLDGHGGPGPGAYEIARSSLNPKGVAIIKSRRDNGGFGGSPGPGDYEVSKSSLSKRGLAALRSLSQTGSKVQSTPGPLDYDPYHHEEKTKFKGAVKFSTSHRDGLGGSIGDIPGPASYENSRSSLKRNGYAISKAPRTIFEKVNLPGPGQYDIPLSSLSQRGVAKMSSVAERSSNADNPGPASYDPFPKNTMTHGSTIPKSGRGGTKLEEIPGPAHYESHIALDKIKLSKGSNAALSRANLHSKVEPTPGPGNYETAISSLSKKGTTSISKAGREGSANQATPGPADYDSGKYFEKEWKKGVSIPGANRNQKSDSTPGPGHYNHISSVPDVASYLAPK
jgi:predicted  nucleic acid-binding Zn-ribbon protein